MRVPNVDGWVVASFNYGTWFVPRAKVAADLKRDRKEAYGADAPPVTESDIDSWWSEHWGWMEVSIHGKQLARPDMAAHEKALMARMRQDTDECQLINDVVKEVRAK